MTPVVESVCSFQSRDIFKKYCRSSVSITIVAQTYTRFLSISVWVSKMSMFTLQAPTWCKRMLRLLTFTHPKSRTPRWKLSQFLVSLNDVYPEFWVVLIIKRPVMFSPFWASWVSLNKKFLYPWSSCCPHFRTSYYSCNHTLL